MIMARKELPTADTLNRLLKYDPETGKLYWNARDDLPGFTSRWAGKEAFTTLERGYRQGRIFSELHYAHRIIWRMQTGETPDDVDHINGDRADNRWENLRAVSRGSNMKNRGLSRQNSSGHHGVYQRPWGWQVYICSNYQRQCIGSFKTKQEAVSARLAAEAIEKFHPNHGKRHGGVAQLESQ